MRSPELYISIENLSRRIYLIVYLGNHNVANQILSNPSALISKTANIKSHPKVIEDIKKHDDVKPQKLYMITQAKFNKELLEKGIHSDIHQDIYAPKNLNQIKQIQHNEREKQKISKDQVFNAYEIGLTLQPFVFDFQLIPELLIIFSKKVIQMLQ